MQIEFHDKYVIIVLVGLLLLCNFKCICSGLKDCLVMLAEFECLTPDCIGPQLHFWIQHFLTNSVRAFLTTFCYLQPLILVFIVWLNQYRKEENLSSTLVFCTSVVDEHDIPYKNSHIASNGTHVEDMTSSLVDLNCFEIDYVLVCLPYAFAVSISTLTWLNLIKQGVLTETLAWNDTLYENSDGKILLYDIFYLVETFCMNVCFLLLCVTSTGIWSIYYLSFALTMVMAVIVSMGRHHIENACENFLSMMVFGFVLILLFPLYLDLIMVHNSFACGIAVVHAFVVFLFLTGHFISGGEATAAYILSLRITLTCIVSTCNIILLIVGVNRLREGV